MRRTARHVLAVATSAALAALAAGCGSPAAPPPSHPSTGDSRTAVVSGTPATADGALRKLGIHHVFLVVLENESYHDSYVANSHSWLGDKLQKQGVLLTRYYATGHHSLDNYLAILSGQAPSPGTSSDCQYYRDFRPRPSQIKPKSGQAVGDGCVYSSNVKTLANQLTTTHHTWRGYMEDMGNTKSREPARCGQPGSPSGESGTKDGTQRATSKDQYAARHNPFVYFHSLLDTGLCKTNVVPLSKLPADLKKVSTTRNFSLITPNLCDDGHDSPCKGTDAKGGRAGGLTAVDHWLSVWVPRIQASPAFKKDGLLIITTDESVGSDTAACCNEKPGPNQSKPGITGPGGGRIGALVIGRCVPKGKQVTARYNHYSLLRSLEDLFGITTGGTDKHGHLGFAAATGLKPLGAAVFARC